MYSGGSGTIGDPYLIATPQDLYDIRSNLSAYFKLTKDIDLVGSGFLPWARIGTTPISLAFSGSVEGDGHVINGFEHDVSVSSLNGLFGYCNGAYFARIGMENVNTETTNSMANSGVLVGDCLNGTIVEQCYASGKFKVSTSGGNQIGGLVGQSESSTDRIRDCWTNVELRGNLNIGGVVGFSGGGAGTVERCYAAGNIEADENVGGIVSFAGGVSNCAAVMDSLTAVGSKTTFYRVSGTIPSNCYANSAMTLPRTPVSDANGQDGLDKTLAQLKQKATYQTGLGWDFSDIWYIRENKGFPLLRAFRKVASALFFGTNF